MEDFEEAYNHFHDLIRGMQVGDVNVVAYCIPAEAKREWSFAKFFIHMTRNSLMHRRCSRRSEVFKVSARTSMADEVEKLYSRWIESKVEQVLGVGGGDGQGSDQSVHLVPYSNLVHLHQNELIVVEDGFDMGVPNFM